MSTDTTSDLTALLAEHDRLREQMARLERDLARFRSIIEDTSCSSPKWTQMVSSRM